jgi:hypothetical protein
MQPLAPSRPEVLACARMTELYICFYLYKGVLLAQARTSGGMGRTGHIGRDRIEAVRRIGGNTATCGLIRPLVA